MISSSELAGLRAALRLVQRDLDSHPRVETRNRPAEAEDQAGDEADGPAGIPRAARLQLVGTEQGVFVALPDGRFWPAGAGPLPGGTQGGATVVAVAMRVQECLAEILWHSWPRCSDHDTALRPEACDDDAVWCCDADVGHQVAAIGRLAQSGSSPLGAPTGT
ncbi:hypothetical protein [Pseudofrankia sp. DC12]|uniref:hypothetical protein n=1 Tax=Pseudofrankia sp. DC12 TaxID=683315 RepID=UPI0005F78B87|nr:hypothetical protein [Pseudofrankia sp. DC12]